MEPGRLRHRVSLWSREVIPEGDGAGNHEGAFQVRFNRRAARTYLKAGEQVLAARLSGVAPAVFRIRADSQTKLISTAWMVREEYGAVDVNGLLPSFNIRSIQIDNDGRWIDLTCESGVALG